MAVISFSCPACKHVLKASSEKAGRRAKCSKCGKEVTVPASQEEANKPPPAPPPPPLPDEDDDGVATYGLVQEEEAAKGEIKAETPKKKEEKKTRRKLKLKTVQFPELWEKVRIGLMILFVAVCVWGAGFAIQSVVLLLGAFSGPQYASLMEKLVAKQQAPIGEEPAIPRFDLAVGLIAGSENLDLARTLLIIVQVLSLFQTGIALTGYFFCLMVPNRYGTKGLAITLCVLAALNALLVVMFKLLPMTGMSNFVLWYFLTPEVSLMTPSMERVVPLAIFWAHAPFWEILLGLLFTLCLFAEPILVCLFLRACALSLRDDNLQPKAMILVQLAFGTAFIMIGYQLLSLTGTSTVVIVYILKAIYLLWMLFFAWLLVWYGRVLLESRKTILRYLVATEEQAAEEEARGEGDKSKKKVPAYLRGGDDDEDDEDEDEDEDDEDEDEDED